MEYCIEIFHEEFNTPVVYPATNKLLEVREDAKKLSYNKGEFFDLVVEKLLFFVKRYRYNLYTAVGFLTTRLYKSDIDDWEKFRRILRFVHCIFKLKRYFGATSLDKIFTWVDVSCAVHHDIKSNNGGVVSM